MSYLLPHVLVLINLSRHPIPLLGEAPRRVIHLPVSLCLLASCPPAPLSSRSVSLLVGRDGLAMGVVSVCDYGGRADVVQMSCGCLLLGSLTLRLPIAPLHRHGWRGGELVPSSLAFFGFLPSTVLVSVLS